MRATTVVTEVGNGLRRNLGLTVAVVLVVLVASIMGGIAFLLHEQVNVMKDYWYDKVEVSVYLCGTDSVAASCNGQAVTDAERSQIQADLQSLPQVQKVYYESKAEAYAHFEQQFKGSPIAQNAPPDSLPESFRVKLKDPKQYAVVAGAFTGRAGVEEVQDERALLDKLFSALNGIQTVGVFIAILMVGAALLLISNTIRVAAFTRRRETGIMRLVGASNLSIQLPFLLESIVAAMVGAVVAAGFLALGKAVLIDHTLAPNFQFTPFFGWGSVWKAAILVLVVSMLIAAGASLVTLRRYLRI
ncbi:MAG TPA: permease-like cell division protein FtsX [Actinomycetes bacterium]|jgi:cell division transport system permease protein